MDIKTKTSIFTLGSILLFFVVWIVYDIWAIAQGGTEASISFMMYKWAYKYPIFTWAIGFSNGLLVGHFFWRIMDTSTTKILTENSKI